MQSLGKLWDDHTLTAATFFLIVYVHFCVARGLLSISTHVFPGFSTGGNAVDAAYWVLDCLSGTVLLALVALLSIGGIMERIQVRQ